MEGISSAEELRNQLADHIATSPHTASLHDIQQRMEALHPEVLMKGGDIHTAMMYLEQYDPHSFHK